MDHVVVGRQEAYSFHRNDILPLFVDTPVYAAAEDVSLMNRMKTEKKKCQEDEEYLCY